MLTCVTIVAVYMGPIMSETGLTGTFPQGGIPPGGMLRIDNGAGAVGHR